MKDHGRYEFDNTPVVAFCSAKTALELKDAMPKDIAVNTLIVTKYLNDDECIVATVHDFKQFLKEHGTSYLQK